MPYRIKRIIWRLRNRRPFFLRPIDPSAIPFTSREEDGRTIRRYKPGNYLTISPFLVDRSDTTYMLYGVRLYHYRKAEKWYAIMVPSGISNARIEGAYMRMGLTWPERLLNWLHL